MKKFLIKIVYVGIPFLLIMLFPNVLKLKTSGDLGRLGLIYFDESYRKNFCIPKSDTLQSSYYKTAKELLEHNNADVLVIGDSFAHTFFQDHLVEKCNCRVTTLYHGVNVEASDILTTLLSIKGNKIPKLVILESVERNFLCRLSQIQVNMILEIDSIYYKPRQNQKTPINVAQDFYKNKVGLNNVVNHVMLSRDLFTCKGKTNDLYFYVDDIFEYTENDLNKAYKNLELLHKYALTQGIYLIYMVAADKYDVYQQFIVDNPYKSNNLLSKGNCFDSLPYFINTKNVLTDAAENGVKDIYWADDTHWSPIGAKIVAEEIARRLSAIDY